jgi:outer membrane protein TolC
MSRQSRKCLVLVVCFGVLLPGCRPQQPFYFHDDGDLSHYVGSASELENPDVDESGLAEVAHPDAPRSLVNAGKKDVWILKLEEAVSITLANSKVFRQLGGRIIPGNSGPSPEVLLRNPQAIVGVYDPAFIQAGEEDALAVYDPFFGTTLGTGKLFEPRNQRSSFLRSSFNEQELGRWIAGIDKRAATGALFRLENDITYNQQNSPTNDPLVPVISDWNVRFGVSVEQPLLRGAGVAYNRIAGPDASATGGPNPVDRLAGPGRLGGTPDGGFDGIVIARINTDIRLADFEAGVRNLVNDTETAYWNLYFAYRNLAATRTGRDSALQTWKRIDALKRSGSKGGEQENWAQAKEQYYLFRGQMENALSEVYRAESRLRYMMGLAATDNRLIKPGDEPTTAKVAFDWTEIHAEGLARSVELRQQKWRIKQRELELSASKNLLLPYLGAFANYGWEGLGDDLISSNRGPVDPVFGPAPGSNAFAGLTSGDFQSWTLGAHFKMNLGFRQELATIRRQELLLARERAIMEDQELEVSHQMADAIRDMQGLYVVTQTAFNRRVSAKQQVEAVQEAYTAGTATLDLLLDAQRRLADADIEYYRSLVNYNLSVTNVHFRKNSLLEYNGIYLAEGPWPGKAYFDATRLARKRDASMYHDFGVTQPRVMSTGPIDQGTGGHHGGHTGAHGGERILEEVPTPADPRPADAPQPRQQQMPRHEPKPDLLPPPPKVDPGKAASRGSRKMASRDRFDWGALGLETASTAKRVSHEAQR